MRLLFVEVGLAKQLELQSIRARLLLLVDRQLAGVNAGAKIPQ
jgi:hypothetical protein